jgi:hemolysin activation/secretion protein
VPLEQYSVGGPENVRAFPVAQTLWDRAFFYSFELLFNAPFIADQPAFENRTWGELLQFSMFYDFAVGRLNEPLVSDVRGYENFRGAGLGLRFNLPGTIESRVFWAWELGGQDIGNDKKPQFWGDFTYSF